MSTPIEESNLAHIGSEEDRNLKKAAAETEANWEGAGSSEGIQIWRVENLRDENGNAKFGINHWPEERYGEFYNGDSYIVLHTQKEDEDSEKLVYDIYFWIGSESSQDEYGVAAYKAVELDDLLGDAPIQHREVQHFESEQFMKCFPESIKYLDGGIDSGFRNIEEGAGSIDLNLSHRLYQVRRAAKVTRCVQVPASSGSLSHSDAFVLDTGSVIYTWFGDNSTPFEKNKASAVAHNLTVKRNGEAVKEEDVGEENGAFWEALGGNQGDIKETIETDSLEYPEEHETKMYILSDVDSILKVDECDTVDKSNLVPDDVCLIDTGKAIFVWIGEGSSMREQSQAMILAQRHIGGINRSSNTNVVRVLQGQEDRVLGFNEAF